MLEGGLIVPGADSMKGSAIEETAQHYWHQICGVGARNANDIVLSQMHRLQLLGDAYGKAYGLAIGQGSALRVGNLQVKEFKLIMFVSF